MDADSIGRAVVACQRGSLDDLDELVQAGLSASSVDQDGCSLLHWAAINNRVPIIERLLSLGADPNILGGVLKSSPLHWGARVGNVPSCALLIKAGASCHVRDTQGYTPIHLAVQGQHSQLVAYMLEKFDGAADLTDNSGMTPTMWAAYRSFTLFPLRLLIRKGADIDVKEDLQGNTALHLAAQERNYTAVSELINAGADVTIRNQQQETPLDIAKNNRNQKIIALIEKGVRKQAGGPSSCLENDTLRKTWQFLLPSLVFLLAGVLFETVHYGIAAGVLLLLAIVLMCTIKIDMHGVNASLVPIGICVAEPICMLVTWSAHLHWFAPWWLQILFLSTLAVLFGCLAKLFFGDPGVIAAADNADTFVETVESLAPRISYCFTCWVDKVPGSKHCSVCDRCVRGFDHHCPWLHQCVTKRNLREFLVFTFCVGLSAAIYTAATFRLLLNEGRDFGFDYLMERRCFIMATMVLAVFHAFALSMLFFTQCIQISARMTTHDRIQMHRHGGVHGGGTPDPASYPRQSTSTSGSHSHSHHDSPFEHRELTCSQRIVNLLEFCSGQY